MNHFNLIVLAVFTATASLCAQNEAASDPKTFTVIRGGMGISMGDYGAIQMNNPYAAYANNGFNLHSLIGIPINKLKGLGVAVRIDYFKNSFNLTAAFKQVEKDPAYNYTMKTSGAYSGFSGMSGIMYSVPVGRCYIDATIMGGALLFSNPSLYLTVDDGAGQKATVGYSDASAVAFNLNAGLYMRIPLGESMIVSFGSDYMISNPTTTVVYKDFDYDSNGNMITTTERLHNDYAVRVFNISAGIGFTW